MSRFSRKKTQPRKKRISILAALLLLMLPASGTTATPAATSTSIDAADKAFIALDYDKAEALYNNLTDTMPESADLYWKLARLNISLAEAIDPKEKALRLPYYSKAVEYAQKSVQLDNSNASAHTWFAAALALKADKVGAKEKVKRAAEIRQELELALKLNPKDDIAWSMLGSYHYQVSRIGWFNRFLGNAFIGEMPEGNREAAEKEFRIAISLNPRVIRHYHELALLYLDEDRKKEAFDILRAAENKPVLMKSDVRRLEEIKKLLGKLSRELE